MHFQKKFKMYTTCDEFLFFVKLVHARVLPGVAFLHKHANESMFDFPLDTFLAFYVSWCGGKKCEIFK